MDERKTLKEYTEEVSEAYEALKEKYGDDLNIIMNLLSFSIQAKNADK